MTDPKLRPKEPETVSCDVCMKEIPSDVAKSEEGTEYVYHFCGQECFEKWQRKGDKKEHK